MSQKRDNTNKHAPLSWVKIVLVTLTILTIVLLAVTVARLIPITSRYYTDADTIRVPYDGAQIRDILWQPAKSLTELINTGEDDYEPCLSADGSRLFFVRGKAGENAEIFTSIRTLHGWSEPVALSDVNSEYEDLGPAPTADGSALYFYSDRPGGYGGYDLWVSYRGESGWQAAINLGPDVNSGYNDYGPSLTPDGKTLYFASNRPRAEDETQPDPDAWNATLREDLFQRDYDLYSANITDSGMTLAKGLVAINSPYNEGAPAVSSFGDFLYFSSDRPGGEGGFDLYRSRRVAGELRSPRNLGSAVNTSANELDPGLSLGGYALYFSSDRTLDTNLSDPAGPVGQGVAAVEDVAASRHRSYGLFYTNSREVFTDIEQRDRAPINWAALWAALGPNLLWALLALLLLLALLALMREAENRRLSLISKCLLASLMAHVLLMLLFNVYEVTSSMASEFRRRGRIQVALVSPVAGSDIARQIRGDLTEAVAPEPPTMTVNRHSTQVDVDARPEPAVLDVAPSTFQHIAQSRAEVTMADARVERDPTDNIVVNNAELLRAQKQVVSATNLPRESQPESRDDPVRPQPEHPEATQVVPRPTMQVAQRTPTDAMARLSPDSAASSSIVENASSLSRDPSSSATEAALPSQVLFDSDTVIVSVDQTPTRDIALPAAPIDRPVDTVEPAALVATKTVAANRRAFDPTKPLPQSPTTTVTIDPLPPRPLLDTPSLAASGDANFVESGATYVLVASSMAVEVEVTSMPQAPLALGNLETAPSSANESPGAVPSTNVEATSRRAVPVRESLGRTVKSLVQLEPTRSTEAESDSTLASGAYAQVVDSPTKTGIVEGLFGGLNPSLPDLEDVVLPTLEQADADAAGEAASDPDLLFAVRTESRAKFSMDASQGLDATTWRRSDLPGRTRLPFGDGMATAVQISTVEAASFSADRFAFAVVPDTLDLPVPGAAFLKLSLPTDERPPDDPYVQRLADGRLSLVERMGGSVATEEAILRALAWLAEHQSENGRWDGEAFDDSCGECGGETDIEIDRALTGLALLCFYGAGHTHLADGPYRKHMERGIEFLLNDVRNDGDLRGGESMYTQGIVTMVLAEAYGMSRDKRFVGPIGAAAGFIDRARNPRDGGWRYDPGDRGDTSVLGWQIMALKSASLSGIAVPAGSFRSARKWLDRVSRRGKSGLYAYKPGREPTPSMTAEAMFVQQLLGLPRDDPRMQQSAEYISAYLPDWDDSNTYFWYYATLALFQYRGPLWVSWNEALTQTLLSNQRTDGRAAGSWDPVGEWASDGGRVYQTALCTLMLEVYYRYLPMYTLDGGIEAIGAIRGVVTDASSGHALGGATIRLDLPDRPPVMIVTGPDGTYHLLAPEVPDHFALSASRAGFLPSSANVESAKLEGTTFAVDFQLRPKDDRLIALEADPEVHHLGDNDFSGAINSQFQRESEGAFYERDFVLSASQLAVDLEEAELTLLAKGVQRSHRIRINGVLLDQRLDSAPDDGSFGEFVTRFDPEILVVGKNEFEIIAKPSNSDIDDFEFVNIQIRLIPRE